MSLPSLARADRVLLSIVLLVALLVSLLHWILAPPEKTGSVVRVASTLFNVPSGAKAGYEVLQRLDFATARLRRRISRETLRDVGVLILLHPQEGLARDEVAALEAWIDHGHALVVVPGDDSAAKSLGLDSDYLREWFEWAKLPADSEPRSAIATAEPNAFPTAPEKDSPLTAGLSQLTVPRDRRFAVKSPFRGYSDEDAGARIFWQDESGAIGVEARSGQGTIIALADEYPFTNVGISQDDNGLLLANIVREMSARYPGKVAFDEYHLGLAERDVSSVAIAKLMFAGPWRFAAMQAALLGVLAMFAQAVRFGKPRDVVLRLRRQHREFAEAAGRLFEEAGAASLAANTLYRYYRERLAKLLFVEPQTEDPQLCEALQRRAGPAAAAQWRNAQSAMHGPIGRQKLLALAHEMHRVTETLEHGT